MRSTQVRRISSNFTSTGWFWPISPISPIFDVVMNTSLSHVMKMLVGRQCRNAAHCAVQGVSCATVPAVTACLGSRCFAVGALCSLSRSHANEVQRSSTKFNGDDKMIIISNIFLYIIWNVYNILSSPYDHPLPPLAVTVCCLICTYL